jgi:hypothetical protein
VHILKGGVQIDDIARRVGDIVSVPMADAERLVMSTAADYAEAI